MPVTIHDDGSAYDDADAIYGRISAGLLTAQAGRVRETALRVRVLEERLNLWEHVAGAHSQAAGLGRGLYKPVNGSTQIYEVGYWSNRGGTSMISLVNGNIVRVRNGDPSDASDRQLWIQTITDPTVAAQWTSWSVQYSGTHYGTPQVISDGTAAGFIIYHAKSGGLYRNNSLIWSPPSGAVLSFIPVRGAIDVGWAVVLKEDSFDGNRVIDFYYTKDASNFAYDEMNFRRFRVGTSALLLDDGRISRVFNGTLHHNPRLGDHGMSQSIIIYADEDNVDVDGPPLPYVIRGIGGGAGANYISNSVLYKLSDGYFYLFSSEVHVDGSLAGSTTLGYGLPVWQRSKDLLHWSEPVIGPAVINNWGMSGVVEFGDYLYWADNEVVYRRPTDVIIHELSNYVPEISFDLPRDNQEGSGNATVANPDGVNDALIDLSDREIIVEPGLRTVDGSYEYTKFDRFFIKQCNRQVKNKANRLLLEFGNIWHRLNNDMRDVTNFVGKTVWEDWGPGKRNKSFNYFFVSDTSALTVKEAVSNRLTTRGIALFTGWKGHNSDHTVQFVATTGTPKLIAHYVDAANYLFLQLSGSTLSLWQRIAGVETQIDSAAATGDANPKLRLALKWNTYKAWVNNSLILDGIVSGGFANIQPGYVGTMATSYGITNVHLTDHEYPLKMEHLVRTALAMADFHDVIVGGAESRAYAIVWGPQTDNNTPARALHTMLETEKLQLIWRNGIVEVGRFNDREVIKTIEDTVIDSDQIDQANRRINMAVVDGNEHFWLEVDTADTNRRGRQITKYFDLPELLELDSVKGRAREEINRSAQGASPGGTTPLYFDLWRMDAINWVDNQGNAKEVRIEGFSVEINQSKTPFQRQTFDTSEFSSGSTDGLVDQDADS